MTNSVIAEVFSTIAEKVLQRDPVEELGVIRLKMRAKSKLSEVRSVNRFAEGVDRSLSSCCVVGVIFSKAVTVAGWLEINFGSDQNFWVLVVLKEGFRASKRLRRPLFFPLLSVCAATGLRKNLEAYQKLKIFLKIQKGCVLLLVQHRAAAERARSS